MKIIDQQSAAYTSGIYTFTTFDSITCAKDVNKLFQIYFNAGYITRGIFAELEHDHTSGGDNEEFFYEYIPFLEYIDKTGYDNIDKIKTDFYKPGSSVGFEMHKNRVVTKLPPNQKPDVQITDDELDKAAAPKEVSRPVIAQKTESKNVSIPKSARPEQKGPLPMLILLTALFVFLCITGFFVKSSEITPSSKLVLVLFGSIVALFWTVYIITVRKSKKPVVKNITDHSSIRGTVPRETPKPPARAAASTGQKRFCTRCGIDLDLAGSNNTVEIGGKFYCDVCAARVSAPGWAAEYTCVVCGKTVPEAESVLLEGKRFCRECSYLHLYCRNSGGLGTGRQIPNTGYSEQSHNGSHNVVALKCKVCGRELFCIKGRSKQLGLIRLQGGTYCMGCLRRLFDDSASEILFIIGTAQGNYSKRVEFRGGKYYYAETRAKPVINPTGLYESEEISKEITYDQAVSYASSDEERENLKTIEFIRKTKERLNGSDIDKNVLAHITVGVRGLGSDLGCCGVPYMRCIAGDLWSGATDYDDMRGPQGFDLLPFDKALERFACAVEYYMRNPERFSYYRSPASGTPDAKIDPRYITEGAESVKKVMISHCEYDEKANLYRTTKTFDVVLNDEQSVSEEDYLKNWKSKLEVLFVPASGRPSLDPVYTVARHKDTKQAYIVKEAYLIHDGVRFTWWYISKITEFQLKALQRSQ